MIQGNMAEPNHITSACSRTHHSLRERRAADAGRLRAMLKAILSLYVTWILFWAAVAVFGIGDGGVVAHVWLLISGFPLSFISWAMPHGSISGVVVAAIAALIQLMVLVFIFRRNRKAESA